MAACLQPRSTRSCALLGCPHPRQAALCIKLPARRYPVLSHSSSGGLAADGRTNTIILTGKPLERGNRSMAWCPSFAKLFLWAVGGATAASPSYPRKLGAPSDGQGLSPLFNHRHRWAQPAVLCPHLSAAKAAQPLNKLCVLALTCAR